ncbi:hypothetical protein PUN28_011165 [Cardiocondyla obscurior]|uniref:LEM domain-containing protein n=1 Tax=Cardiocondyla obscurior TaxID=286306 RepID=A0AAW2FLN9_9HYME
MLSTPKTKGDLFLASSLCDGLEDNNIRQVATLLLNKDADPNILIPIHGVTPFHLVIGNDSEEFAQEVTKLFLRHNGNPNVRSVDGMTPVHVAAAWGRINILQLLLANGGDPLCLDNDGRSPFHYAFDGKYFQAVTMLANYCQNIQDEDDKLKYNMVLDKILISNGGVVAEYVTSKDMVDVHNSMHKNALNDLINSKLDTSSMIVDLSCALNVYIENGYKSSNKIILNEYFSRTDHMPTAEIQSNFLQTDSLQKEKCVISQIINNLDYNKNEQEKSITTSNSDTSSDLKENACSKYKYSQIKSKNFKISGKNNSENEDILKLSTRRHHSRNNIDNSFKRKYKDKISLATPHILDNSIISMSPNFNTPIRELKGRNTCKTSLTQSNIYNDLIISASPNLASVCLKKKNLTKTSHVDYLKVFNKSFKYRTQMQHSEFNWHKKHIAQSTPRRKKRLSCKFHSGRKKFDSHQYETDMTSDECNNILKPINLNKTIFFETCEDTSRYNVLDMSRKFSSLNLKKRSERKQQGQYNHLAIKLDEGRYDESEKMENKDVRLDASNSFYQIAKENKSVNNISKSENNEINTGYIVIKKNICNNNEKSVNTNIKSLHTTESDSLQNENFTDCIDCDTRNLLNEDLIVNISRTCSLHVKNWRSDKFYTSPIHKSFIENNSLPAEDLSVQCKKQIYLLDYQKLCSSKSTKSKETESLWTVNDFDVHNTERNSSLSSYVSTQEYKYEDPEEGVILLERRLCVTPFSSSRRSECDSESKVAVSGASNISRVSPSLPEEILFIDDVTLRQKLGQLGDQPGPITNTTRQLYQKRLLRLKSITDANTVSFVPNLQNSSKNHTSVVSSNKIKSYMEFGNWLHHLDTYKNLEKQVFQEFASPDPSRRWREGTAKTSFTYLLLDPRITQDLPNRSANLTKSQVWSIFLNSIFYIGKGKCSRPFAHLYDAFKTWVDSSTITNKKIDCILNIWNSDYGVVCLHVFQNTIPVEAYTREAAMIDAIGKEHLTNLKGGEYYGIAATWNVQQKQKFGRYLLYKALQIFLQEGESQLFPYNL